MYRAFTETFPVISIEDPFEEDAWDEFSQITFAMPNIQWVGDDLLVTNIKRVKTGIEKKACNTLLLKVRLSVYLYRVGQKKLRQIFLAITLVNMDRF